MAAEAHLSSGLAQAGDGRVSAPASRPPGKLIWPAWSQQVVGAALSSTRSGPRAHRWAKARRLASALRAANSAPSPRIGRTRRRREAQRRRAAVARGSTAVRDGHGAGHRDGVGQRDAGGLWRIVGMKTAARTADLRAAVAARVKSGRCARCGQAFPDAGRLAAAARAGKQLGAAHVAAALDLDAGDQRAVSWKVRSTPSPLEILRTMKLLFRPRLRLAMTTPS